MAHLSHSSAYHQFVQRLNRSPQGAPPSETLYQILKLLFSEEEAKLLALLPIRLFTAEKAARIWGHDVATTRKRLDTLCGRGLLVDFELNGITSYCLPPPMTGFLEFSMMRVRGDIDQKALAELLYKYVNVEEDFSRALYANGPTQYGRAFVDETQLPASPVLEIMDHERASQVIHGATHIGVSLCYCRHKMSHMNLACDTPQETCLTLNLAGAALIRHGHSRSIEAAEAMDILQRARENHLVQFGENVRRDVSFLCNCCKCCCDAMLAARSFAMAHSVQSTNFLAELDAHHCTGCGLCVQHCPVEALSLVKEATEKNESRKSVQFNAEICLGCGVCAGACPTGAVTMAVRPQRFITPLNTAHRVVLMAIERGTLPHLLLDNRVMESYQSLAAFLGVLFKLPPIKRLLANQQLQSRYLEAIIQRLKWQPLNEPRCAGSGKMKAEK